MSQFDFLLFFLSQQYYVQVMYTKHLILNPYSLYLVHHVDKDLRFSQYLEF